MTWTVMGCGPARLAARWLMLTGLVLGGSLVAGCDLLDVTDPTTLEDDDLDNATGADLMRKDAVNRLSGAIGTSALSSGLLADEFFSDPSLGSTRPWHEDVLDQRESEQYEQVASASTSSAYGQLQEARHAAIEALPRVRAYAAQPARAAYTGQVLALRGYTTLRLAEDFCPGFPLNDVVNGKIIFGPPVTTTDAFEQALADFDSAVVAAVDTARFLHLAQVGRARTLLALGRFDEAAAAAQPVPDDFAWYAEFDTSSPQGRQLVFQYSSSGNRLSVSDNEGANGLDFGSADDPRVVAPVLGMAYDGTTPVRAIGKYPTAGTSIVVASGIEARLIEAEGALRTGGNWLDMLNELRTDGMQTDGSWNAGIGGVPGLPPLADPGSEAGRVDLLFRERAFWLFATGSRLADLRRLIGHYNRSPESVFPSGAYRVGGTYGTATSVPFPAEPESAENPAITGCTSR